MKIYISLATILSVLLQISPTIAKYDPTIPGPQLPAIAKSQWATDCLKAHNYFRSLYVDSQTNKPLSNFSWNGRLARSATQWANVLLNKKPSRNRDVDVNDHKPNNPYGENMAANSYGWRDNWRCAATINRYHKEKANYMDAKREFYTTNPGEFWKLKDPKGEMAHFTQLTWIKTRSVGCGYAQNAVKRIEVCHYEPR
jgi:hypothetical protein